jgi:hypothetical protein
LGREVAGPSLDAQRGEAGRDRPRGHQDNLGAGDATGGEGVDEGVEPGGVEAATGSGQRGRTDLYHDPPRPGHR